MAAFFFTINIIITKSFSLHFHLQDCSFFDIIKMTTKQTFEMSCNDNNNNVLLLLWRVSDVLIVSDETDPFPGSTWCSFRIWCPPVWCRTEAERSRPSAPGPTATWTPGRWWCSRLKRTQDKTNAWSVTQRLCERRRQRFRCIMGQHGPRQALLVGLLSQREVKRPLCCPLGAALSHSYRSNQSAVRGYLGSCWTQESEHFVYPREGLLQHQLMFLNVQISAFWGRYRFYMKWSEWSASVTAGSSTVSRLSLWG